MKIIEGVELYDYDDLIKLFGVSRNAVAKMVARSGVESVIIQRKKYISKKNLKSLLKG